MPSASKSMSMVSGELLLVSFMLSSCCSVDKESIIAVGGSQRWDFASLLSPLIITNAHPEIPLERGFRDEIAGKFPQLCINVRIRL